MSTKSVKLANAGKRMVIWRVKRESLPQFLRGKCFREWKRDLWVVCRRRQQQADRAPVRAPIIWGKMLCLRWSQGRTRSSQSTDEWISLQIHDHHVLQPRQQESSPSLSHHYVWARCSHQLHQEELDSLHLLSSALHLQSLHQVCYNPFHCQYCCEQPSS